MSKTVRAFVLCTLLVPGLAGATDYTVLQDQSRLGFTATFQGESFDGSFGQWQADIRYDPKDLAQSRFDVTVDTTSAVTGDDDRDKALPGSDFFNATQYPKAHYVTTGFRRLPGGGVVADGELTLRGVSRPVTLGVSFAPTADGATLDVATTLDRLAFGVGGGEYADTSVIGEKVKVAAHLVLRRKP